VGRRRGGEAGAGARPVRAGDGASALGFWCGEGLSRRGAVGRVGFCGRGTGGLGAPLASAGQLGLGGRLGV